MKQAVLLFILWVSRTWALSCSAPVIIGEDGLITSSVAACSINHDGEVALIWSSYTKTRQILYLVTRGEGKQWSSPSVILDSESRILNPTIKIGAGEHLYSSWILVKNPQGDAKAFCQYAEKEKNSAWSRPKNVVKPEDFLPGLTWLDDQGNLLVLGRTISSFAPLISLQYQHQNDKITRQEFSSIPFYNCIFSNYRDNLNNEQMPILFWIEKNSEGFASNPVLQGIKLPTEVSPLKISNLCNLDLQSDYPSFFGRMNSRDDYAIIWWQLCPRAPYNKLQAVVCLDQQKSEPFDLAASNDESYSNHQISIDEEGNALAVWSQSQMTPEKNSGIFAAYKPRNKPWSTPELISDPAKSSYQFQVDKDNIGHFIVIWVSETWNEKLIYGMSLSTKTAKKSFALLSPPGQQYLNPFMIYNTNGKGIIFWEVCLPNHVKIQAADFYHE